MTKEEEFEAMKILLCSLERRISELEKERALSFPIHAVSKWDDFKTAARTHNPFHLSAVTI